MGAATTHIKLICSDSFFKKDVDEVIKCGKMIIVR